MPCVRPLYYFAHAEQRVRLVIHIHKRSGSIPVDGAGSARKEIKQEVVHVSVGP